MYIVQNTDHCQNMDQEKNFWKLFNFCYFGPIRGQMFPILAGQDCYNSLSGCLDLSSWDHVLKIKFISAGSRNTMWRKKTFARHEGRIPQPTVERCSSNVFNNHTVPGGYLLVFGVYYHFHCHCHCLRLFFESPCLLITLSLPHYWPVMLLSCQGTAKN